MKYPVNITTPPGAEPLTTAEAKTYLREDRSVEDSLIDQFVVAARKALERHTGYHLIDTVFEMKLEDFTDVKLPKKPLKTGSVSITYLDTDGASQTLVSSKYNVHEEESPVAIEFLDNLPDLYDDDSSKYNVTIQFTCGYGTAASNVPDDWKTAVSLVTMLLWMRDGEDVNPLNYSLVQLHLQNYKIGRFK